MRVQVHTKFCLLCVLTFLFHQCHHCHQGHAHQHAGHHHHDDSHQSSRHNDLQISEVRYVKETTMSPKGADGATLEEEQRFYIQQLFTRYGQKDRLDFQGFQSLLFSLGLGEVKVVSVDHEELGHDHVAHLDVLDMQEGLHGHEAQGPDHGAGHGHGHTHHKTGPHRPHADREPTTCSQTTAASPASNAPTNHHHHHGDADHHKHKHSDGHVHKTDRVTHDHDNDLPHGHNKVGETDSKSPDGQVHITHGDDDAKNKEHDHDHDHDHDHKDHEPHDHHDKDQNQVQTVTESSPLIGQQVSTSHHEEPPSPPKLLPSTTPAKVLPSNAPTMSQSKKLRKPMRDKGHRTRNKVPLLPTEHSSDNDKHNHDHDHDHSHDHGHNHDHGHSHKHKREAPQGWPTPVVPGSGSIGHQGGLSHQHEECLNITQLLTYYGLSPDSVISPSQFTYLCPALLYQIDSRVCIRHDHLEVAQEAMEPVSSVWVWLWSFVSITIISLLSLLGVVLVPILKQSCFKFLLTFLVALAVGTLSGDALLHLLPHSQGHHDHSQHGSSHSDDLVTAFDGVWKGLTALAGIYFLFIVEHCIGMFKHFKDQRDLKNRNEEGNIGRKLSDHKLNRRSDAEWLHLKSLTEDPDTTVVSCDNGHNDTQLSELQTPDSPTNRTPLTPVGPRPEPPSPVKKNGRKAKTHRHSHGHGHSHGGNCHSDKEMKEAGIASIAWMVIMGDGMHNFSDGLAIGAAFSANLTGGISTSVAVFCHELPHELGDFAVLLKAGMSVKQAIVYNLLSALMAYVGMIIGTAVGQYTHNVTSWIFAITAGMFLYVALVDMLPEMLHGDGEDHWQLGHFILQNMGLLCGFTIMLLIAIFEDRIVFNFNF